MPFSPPEEREINTIASANNSCLLPPLTKSIVLSVEGNIGAGKSTFLKVLNKYFGEDNIEVLPEPVDRWVNCRGQNLLETFYRDPARYAYTFQSFAFVTRLMQQQKPQKKPIRILERSAYSDRCFAENAYKSGLMNEVEWAAYLEWWSFFAHSMPGAPNGIIYLWTTPEICHERMSIRNRNEEKGVPIEYLQQLHDQHEKWLPETSNSDACGKLPVARINASTDFEHHPEQQELLISHVIELIHRVEGMKQ